MRWNRTLPVLLVLVLCSVVAHAQEAGAPATASDVRRMAEAGQSFRGLALAGLDLAGQRFEGLDLTSTNWARTDLRGAVFSSVNLSGAILDEMNARGAVFTDSDLTGATVRHADLSGALLSGLQLAGTDLAGSKLHGAEFQDCFYSRTGGRHTGAISAALAALTSTAPRVGASPWTAPMAAGLSGDAFAFVYNTANPRYWPMSPFTESPVAAAATAAGHTVRTSLDQSLTRSVEVLVEALRAGQVCILPLSLAGAEMRGDDLQQAFWGAAVTMNDVETPAKVVVLAPPFGRREYLPSELAARWDGPWPTLAAAGTERSEARFPLYMISRGASPYGPREASLAALRQAAAIINERRTFTALVPGRAGMERLAEDLERAGRTGEAQRMADLAAWAGNPRRLLVSARRQAAEFLEQAAAVALPMERGEIARAAVIYHSVAQMLAEEFPSLEPDTSLSDEELRARYLQAALTMAEVARLEASAARTFQSIGGE